MNLRIKTLLIVGGIIIGISLILYGVSQTILLEGFIEIEKQSISKNVERCVSVLHDDIEELNALNYDWSAWDDTYNFIQNANEEYIESNLVNSTFTTIRVNVMLYFNSSGNLIFGKAVDLQNGTEVPIPQGLLNQIYENDVLLYHYSTDSNISGIIIHKNAILISSLPILTSEDEGPVQGTLIMARYLDSAEIERLARLTQLSFNITIINKTKLPSYLQKEIPSMEKGEIFVHPIDEKSITGYAMLKDIYGKPALLLKIDMPREIYQQGKITLHYYTLSLISISFVFIILLLFLLDKSVLSRLVKLNSNVKNIAESGDASERVEIEGKDEITSLANEINNMLESLEKSEQEVRRALEQERV